MPERHHQESKLFVRIFPICDRDWDCFKVESKKKDLYLRSLEDLKKSNLRDGEPRFWGFRTDGILENRAQEEVFEEVAGDTAARILEGDSFIFLACGQSGTGKTYTMMGLNHSYDVRGLFPRFLTKFFNEVKEHSKTIEVEIQLSYLELKGRKVHDLLSLKAPTCGPRDESVKRTITTLGEGMRLAFEGESRRGCFCKRGERRDVAAPGGGTAVLTLHVQAVSMTDSQPTLIRSKVHFVDVGGFERAASQKQPSKSQIELNMLKSDLVRFARNMPLFSNSEKTVAALSRESSIARVLGPTIGNSLLRVICHIRPRHEDLAVSISTLQLGNILAGVQPPILPQVPWPDGKLVLRKLEKQLEELKEEMLTRELLSTAAIPCSKALAASSSRLAEAYLAGAVSEEAAMAQFGPRTLLKNIKCLYNGAKRKSLVPASPTQPTESVLTSSLSSQNKLVKKFSDSASRKAKRSFSRREKFVERKSVVGPPSSSTKVEAEEPREIHWEEPQTDEPTSRETIWEEFIRRNPELKRELDSRRKDMEDERRKKKAWIEYYLRLLGDLEKAELEAEEEEEWRGVGRSEADGGYGGWQAVEAMREAAQQARDGMVQEAADFRSKANRWRETALQLESLFQEYSISLYGVSFPLNALGELGSKESREEEEGLLDSSQEHFLHLQKSHFKQNPCPRNKRDWKY